MAAALVQRRDEIIVTMPDGERHPEDGGEHRVSPLELFFDLVMVFAFTQVTRLLANDPTWGGVLRGMLVLARPTFAVSNVALRSCIG